MLSYIYSWIYPEPQERKKQVVYDKDLLKVKLKPVNPVNSIKFSTDTIKLEDILAVNLKKTNINSKQTYEPRHPVLREILKRNQ